MKKLLVVLISSLIMLSYNVYADDGCGWAYESAGWVVNDEGIIEYMQQFAFNQNNGTVEVADYVKYADTTITIPSKIGSVDIIGLGDNWLSLDYVSVYIPNNIKYFSNIDMYKNKNNVYYLEKGSYADEFFKNAGVEIQYVDSVKKINLEDNEIENYIKEAEENKAFLNTKFDDVELDIKNEYMDIIQQYNSGRYFLYDTNGDEIPELYIYNIDENGNLMTDNSEMITKDSNNKTALTKCIMSYYGNSKNSDDSKEGQIFTRKYLIGEGYENGKLVEGFSSSKLSFYDINCNGTNNLIELESRANEDSSKGEGNYIVINKSESFLLLSKYNNSYSNKFSYAYASDSVLKKFLDGKRMYANMRINSDNIDDEKAEKITDEIRKNPVKTYSVNDLSGLNNWDFNNIKISQNKVEDNNINKITNDNNDIVVVLNDNPLSFTQSPVIENGTTLVPMRAIFEAMGATVEWNNDTKTVTSVKNDTTVSLTLNKDTAIVNDEEISLAVPAKLVNGNTMVPLRFVSESLGAEVNWNGESKTITINSK